MNTKAIRQLADVTLDKYRSSIPRKAFEEFVKDIITGENRATAFRYEASPICRASFPSTLDEDGARCIDARRIGWPVWIDGNIAVLIQGNDAL